MAQENIDPRSKPRRDGLTQPRARAPSADAAGNSIESSDARPAKTKSLTADERTERIAKAAYSRAQQRGFAPGYEWDDWFSAEREIDAEIQALMSRSSLPGS